MAMPAVVALAAVLHRLVAVTASGLFLSPIQPDSETLTQDQDSMDCQAAAATDSHLDKLRQVFTIVLQSHQPNCLQDAATFSSLLCTNSQLREAMLQAAAGGHLTVTWPTSTFEGDVRSMVQWLEQHVRLRTLKHLELGGDVLSTPLHAYGALRDAIDMQEHGWRFCSRVASALASAVAYLPAGQYLLPEVQGWFCNRELMCLGNDSHPLVFAISDGSVVQHGTTLAVYILIQLQWQGCARMVARCLNPGPVRGTPYKYPRHCSPCACKCAPGKRIVAIQ